MPLQLAAVRLPVYEYKHAFNIFTVEGDIPLRTPLSMQLQILPLNELMGTLPDSWKSLSQVSH